MDAQASNDISEREIRLALDRISCSPPFMMSERLRRFLQFAVDNALAGKASSLKETVIGVEVYDRPPSYDPASDSIVRSEARRLRTKLENYYQSIGSEDDIIIDFPLGAYAPKFSRRTEIVVAKEISEGNAEAFDWKGPKVTLAVIPLMDMSGNATSASLSKSLTEELIHALADTPGIRTAAATASHLGVQPTDIPSLAKKLDVKFLLEGSVREANGQIRIVIRLISARGLLIWSQIFESEARQDGSFCFAQRVASAMVSRIRPEQSSIRFFNAEVDSDVLAALPFVYAGEALLDQCTFDDRKTGLLKFAEAAKIAPALARTYCGISQCHYETALSGVPCSAAVLASARDAAIRAQELDAHMVAVHQSIACVLWLEGDTPEAEIEFQRALESGSHAGGHREYGMFLTAQGRFDEAWHHLSKAQQIDPFSQRQKFACSKFLQISCRMDEEEEYLQESRSLGPLPLAAEICLSLGHALEGNHSKSLEIIAKARRLAPTVPQVLAAATECHALSGDIKAAIQIATDFSLLKPEGSLSHFRRTLIFASLGYLDEASKALKAAEDQREPELAWLKADPRLRLLCTR